jgi:purine-binding chemotaxis protein CheW
MNAPAIVKPKHNSDTHAPSFVHTSSRTIEYLSIFVADELFGVRVSDIRDVFALKNLTPVPGAKPHIAGVLNLRGRIVTAIDARRKLNLQPDLDGYAGMMAVGVEQDGEAYSILVDKVGDVLALADNDLAPCPANLDAQWRKISRGVYRLEGKLLVTLDLDHFLASDSHPPSGA